MAKAADNSGASIPERFEYALGDEMRGERATLGKSLLDVQRDLRIKAAYIAAIENADPQVFPNPSFIPGYVRSYARYLGLDAEQIYARFCAESGFSVHGGSPKVASGRPNAPAAKAGSGVFSPNFPMTEVARVGLSALPVGAIASVLVLSGLVAGLGYGGWTVLQNIQRVQFAPVEELPAALASVDDLTSPAAPSLADPSAADLASPVAAQALADLYRHPELEVPILVPRDGPIAAIDPERVGLLAGRNVAAEPVVVASEVQGPAGPSSPLEAATAAGLQGPEPLAPTAAAAPALTVVAERAAWVRVYLPDETVIFERILETGETYSPPAGLEPPMIWAGNSGSVYVRLGEVLHGPIGSGTRSVRDIVLDPAQIAGQFAVVETVPETLIQAFDPQIEQAAIAIQ